MKVTKLTLIVLAALVWYSVGIALLFKGSALIKNAYVIDAQSLWIMTAPLLGIIAGLLKGKFLFSKSCRKNIQRIQSLTSPRLWQCFRPGMVLFLAIIIPTGAWMSRAAAGNFTYLCLVGALDLSISFALLTSGMVFLQLKAFSPLEANAG